jgi:hypothetical protein
LSSFIFKVAHSRLGRSAFRDCPLPPRKFERREGGSTNPKQQRAGGSRLLFPNPNSNCARRTLSLPSLLHLQLLPLLLQNRPPAQLDLVAFERQNLVALIQLILNLLNAALRNLGNMQQPIGARKISTNAPKSTIRTTLPKYVLPTSATAQVSVAVWIQRSAAVPSEEKIFTLPSLDVDLATRRLDDAANHLAARS